MLNNKDNFKFKDGERVFYNLQDYRGCGIIRGRGYLDTWIIEIEEEFGDPIDKTSYPFSCFTTGEQNIRHKHYSLE